MPSGFLRNGAIVIAATVAGVAALAAFLQQPASMADSIAAALPTQPAARVAPAPAPPAAAVSDPAPAAARPASVTEPKIAVRRDAPLVEPPAAASEPPKTAAAPQHVEKPVSAIVDVPPAQSLELSEPKRAEPLAATAASEPAAEKPASAPRAKKTAESRKKARPARQWREDSYDVPALGYDSTGRPRPMRTRPAPFRIGELFSREW
jgi:hypothetical protein